MDVASAPLTLLRAGEPDARPMPAVGLPDGGVVPLSALVRAWGEAAPAELRAGAEAASWLPLWLAGVDLAGALAAALPGVDPSPLRLRQPRLALPLVPGKVIAVGRNYAAHARELGNEAPEAPFFFGKLPSCAVPSGAAIEIPADLHGEVHHEAELAVVIGRAGRAIRGEDAMQHVLGYTCANDVTARTLQKSLQERKLPWFAGKNLDTFLPLGPGVVPASLVPDPHALRVRCTVDGELRQDGSTEQMMHRIPALIAHASRHLTLHPGDVILTGTPAGVGPLRPGQRVVVAIDGIGRLDNPVVARG